MDPNVVAYENIADTKNMTLINKILADFTSLLKQTQSFNSHINMFKKLLNLKDRQNYELLKLSLSSSNEHSDSNTTNSENQCAKVTDSELRSKLETMHEMFMKLKEEVEASHLLGFCLAFNLQCLRKRLTGYPIDVNATKELVSSLRQKHDLSKTREAILKYEFQEKRKLLRKLRRQLEETREEWRNFRIQVPKAVDSSEEEQLMLKKLLRKEFGLKKKEESEDSGYADSAAIGIDSGDSAVQSESDNDCSDSLAEAVFKRKEKLDFLEKECFGLLSDLANKHIQESNETGERQVEDESEMYRSSLLLEINEDMVDEDDDENELSFLEEELYDSLENSEENLAALEAVDDTPGLSGNDELESRIHSENEETSSSVSEQQEQATGMRDTGNEAEDEDEESKEEADNDKDELSFAETGEPLFLCRLRRKAVEILISRLRDEKILHESRESELREQLLKITSSNKELERELIRLRRYQSIIYTSLVIFGLLSSLFGVVFGKSYF
ncbi:FYVE and coiled-coil domain-containing protein 1-like protein [Dinothrombium tinctorium]|uniref:FYVE and coiled-coil domain-containing protein 1-like protein n=1 Tax=Dinothrombium tinctorium TaxID=1965070 RepID=A0A3S3PZ65_9ACAR|nr:FYVE and coiled-coil domain-containing protein 1-like protein [Dinothrombium tinctorium]